MSASRAPRLQPPPRAHPRPGVACPAPARHGFFLPGLPPHRRRRRFLVSRRRFRYAACTDRRPGLDTPAPVTPWLLREPPLAASLTLARAHDAGSIIAPRDDLLPGRCAPPSIRVCCYASVRSPCAYVCSLCGYVCLRPVTSSTAPPKAPQLRPLMGRDWPDWALTRATAPARSSEAHGGGAAWPLPSEATANFAEALRSAVWLL